MTAGMFVHFIMKTLELRQIKCLDQDHTAGREQVSYLPTVSLVLDLC